MAFTYYDTVPVETPPTLQEIIASLTGDQKTGILNAFIRGVRPQVASARLLITYSAVERLYRAIDEIEELSRKLMRGEVLITPGEYDDEGNEITPPVYNTPPVSAAALLSAVQDEFSDVFTAPQVQAVMTKMVEYSKHDGTGDWAFYSTEVIK